jgi:hypothetical protein
MSARQTIRRAAVGLTLLAGSASSQPGPGEDYGHARLPPDAYQRIYIPPDNPSPPQPPPPPPKPEDPPACRPQQLGCPPTEPAEAQQLLASGPDTTDTYTPFENPAHQFSVVGFVKQGWPVSIEYQAEPGTVTILRVQLYHQRRILIFPIPFYEVAFKANLDALPAEVATDDPWHRTVKIDAVTLDRNADPAADGGLHVARYQVRSYYLVNGQVGHRAPLNLIGITVGPEVVGSITLSGAQFDNATQRIPVTNTPPTELGFRYRSDASYDLIRERIEQYDFDGLTYRWPSPIGSPHSATPNQVFSSAWRIRRGLRPGRYRASIIAWWQCHGVTILERMADCQNNPNFAVTNSGDVTLIQ